MTRELVAFFRHYPSVAVHDDSQGAKMCANSVRSLEKVASRQMRLDAVGVGRTGADLFDLALEYS
jgi:hypothetical protein